MIPEAYGILSALVFVIHVSAYTHQPLPQLVRIVTDSKSVLDRMKE